MIGKIHIVSTPIGNLQDITLRALETLKSVDLILCEDTRVTKKLLSRFDIHTRTKSYHHHSNERVYRDILDELENGTNIALVTDAGTPGISDPGNILISYIHAHAPEIEISPIPGPSALTAALSVAGFPTDKFLFLGFPPHKKGRTAYFKQVAGSTFTTAFFESSHRITKSLHELAALLPKETEICICREITKKFESTYRGTIEQILETKIPEKGEFVVIVRPYKGKQLLDATE
ncbi:MAG: 16S rRNA (cytidine(1402)-2'-O)-methyltransferase [Candidatus Magasanikbacteria bacterium CG10_big_fil_rev_8_21_14_0_10_43_6]|uniref:Ribosomal RNA small subunit methyltransferase I n=1 Tax=Candidatus Magasanikbacteria bacterium CG10_big_fil_rev_8_21_14_0_10_43_6 TaxID=1974650 RepID=A0A2M6W2H8_9BACT|nr:MAG: 16S rRNA (cytidine(1402)-2'-O)-methyltransferase [Candidatus Magasanikbacteria bacterium CG10_big_fil_rev_8_21_14_0_10_43_6]